MNKLYFICALICYIMTIACAVFLVILTCMHARMTTIISIGLSMIASALNAAAFTMAYRRE